MRNPIRDTYLLYALGHLDVIWGAGCTLLFEATRLAAAFLIEVERNSNTVIHRKLLRTLFGQVRALHFPWRWPSSTVLQVTARQL